MGVTIGVTGPFTTSGSAAVRAALTGVDVPVGAMAVEMGAAAVVDVADRAVPSNVTLLYASLSIFDADAEMPLSASEVLTALLPRRMNVVVPVGIVTGPKA